MKKNNNPFGIIVLIAFIGLLVYTGYTLWPHIEMQKAKDMMPPHDDKKTYENDYEEKSSNVISSSKTISNKDYSSNNKDENVLLINNKSKVTLSNINITKNGDSDFNDDTSFYGINSAILAKDGANVKLDNINVLSEANGGNGVFSYGDGTEVNIDNSNIITKKDNSGGIMVTGGGSLNSNNTIVTTYGVSSAAIRSDRGGGNINVDGGLFTSNGAGSPAIYSTANILVNNAQLIANSSEGIIIEGKNKVEINSCKLTDNNQVLHGQSTTYKNIFLYQSMSGDATNGTAEFVANDSNIVTNKGDTFYVTNTEANISLKNNIIENNDLEGNFIRVQKDSWGSIGKNGGKVNLYLDNQSVVGNIVVDEISVLNIKMENKSFYEGVINENKNAQSISLELDKSSKIKLLGDSYITKINDANRAYTNIDFNGYKLYVDGVAIN